MIKRIVLIGCFVLLLILQVNGQDAVVESVIALVNSARNQAGVSGLLVSEELHIAAQRHSNDMATSGQLNHTGSDGSQFWQRMMDAGYSLTTGAENLLLRSDTNAQAIFNQWWNSTSHQANMMNPDYVEIGLAYSQSASGTYYFTMVLGQRSSVSAPPIPSPTQIPPSSTPIPPTTTPIPPTATITPTPTATFTATPLIPPTRTLSPLITPVILSPIPTMTASLMPTATPDLPPDLRLIYDADSLTLINISGRRLDISEVAFQSDQGAMASTVWDTEFLTEPLTNFSDSDCLQVWGQQFGTTLEKVPECETRHGWIAVNSRQQFWKEVAAFFVSNEGELVGQCSVADGICDISLEAEFNFVPEDSTIPLPTDRHIRLLFNQDNLTLLSIADVPIDLRGLVFQSSEGTLSVEQWNTEFTTASLSGFPSGDCLMVWKSDVDEQRKPAECKVRHGWIVADAGADFWSRVSRFEVIRDNRVLAGCVVANGYCDVNLSGNLGTNSPTLVPANPASATGTPFDTDSGLSSAAPSGSELLFVYSPDSFTLINSSGRAIDISALVFESDSGVFAANRWNTDFLTASLSDFPSGDCLQIWGVNEQLQSKPGACETRHGWIAVTSALQFWRNASQMRVRYGNEQIGMCDVRAGQCALSIP